MAELKHTEKSSASGVFQNGNNHIREKLVELIKDGIRKGLRARGDDRLDYSFEDVADHLIANNVTVQEWIPVTERLPCGYIVVDPSTNYKELEEYLVFCKGALFPTTAYFVDDKFVSLCETGCPSGERWCGIGEVTHWMSLSALPTPPKGE